MNIRLADKTDAPRWNAFVEHHQQATPYHLWAWREAIEAAYSHQGYYLIAEENGVVNGVLPLVHMRFSMLVNQLVSLPYCDIGGCLANSAETENLLLREAMRVGMGLGVKKIELRTNSLHDHDVIKQEAPQASESHDKVRMLLDLPGRSELLWDSFKSKLRSQINRSMKNGLLFTWGSHDTVDEFYGVFSANMRDLGSPVHAKAWIKAIMGQYSDAARMGLIHKDGVPVGCGIILMVGKQVCIPWASTLREYNNLSPNMLLYWSFLKFASDSNHDRFDFGRSTPGEGTYKFKAQWGAEPQTLYWHAATLGNQPQARDANQRLASGNRERLASPWSRLPLWVANAVGPSLRRNISL